jgi:hypothetical protein
MRAPLTVDEVVDERPVAVLGGLAEEDTERSPVVDGLRIDRGRGGGARPQ